MKQQSNNPELERYLLLAAALIAMVAGLWYGLVRIGWTLPVFRRPDLVAQHGPFMIAGFLGVLIPIERAVAVETRFAFVIPLLSALGMALLVVPALSPTWGRVLITLASIGYTGLFLYFLSIDPQLHAYVMVGGAVAWVAGNVLWTIGWGLPRIVFYWIGFLVLTIAGERLELARTMNLGRKETWSFAGFSLLLATGLVCMSLRPDLGMSRYLTGAGFASLGAWLLVAGPSRRTVRLPGRMRFIAVSLMIGYLWLIATGVFLCIYPWTPAGPVYDAILHSVFLGFVFSMIFAHAPIIFPAVTGKTMTYLPVFYVHTLLLHVSLVMRVIGDLSGGHQLRTWGALINGIAIVLFMVHSVIGIAWRE